MRKGCGIILFVLMAAILFGAGFHVGRGAVHMVAYTVHVNDTIRLSAPAVIKEIEVPVPVDVDTAAILQQYFTKKVYNDPIIKTEYVEVHLTDTVYMNGLLGRTVSYSFRFPEYKHSFFSRCDGRISQLEVNGCIPAQAHRVYR
jgi:hypothetical protein